MLSESCLSVLFSENIESCFCFNLMRSYYILCISFSCSKRSTSSFKAWSCSYSFNLICLFFSIAVIYSIASSNSTYWYSRFGPSYFSCPFSLVESNGNSLFRIWSVFWRFYSSRVIVVLSSHFNFYTCSASKALVTATLRVPRFFDWAFFSSAIFYCCSYSLRRASSFCSLQNHDLL